MPPSSPLPSPPRQPIRIGFIGLSSKPDSWAVLAHLPYLLRSPQHYTIVGLCNSTFAKAHESISAHNLGPQATAYASPAALVSDPANPIDLVVICTRVDTHHDLALPTLLAPEGSSSGPGSDSASGAPTGRRVKAIFIEWPLAATTSQARDLARLAEAQQIRTVIGLQARVSPTLLTIQQIVRSGRLGAIHSVNVHAASGVWQHDVASARYEHFLRREVGGNLLTIYGIHILDAVFAAVGELVPGSYSCLMGNLRPEMRVPSSSGKASSNSDDHHHDHHPEQQDENHNHHQNPTQPNTTTTIPKDTPDQILLIGRLAVQYSSPPPSPSPSPSPSTHTSARTPTHTLTTPPAPALLSLHLRAGSRAADHPGARWRIYGDAAELVVEFASAGPQIAQATKIEIHHFAGSAGDSAAGSAPGSASSPTEASKAKAAASAKEAAAAKAASYVEDIPIPLGTPGHDGEWWSALPVSGQNIGRLYEAFARDEDVPGWDVAVRRHELIDEFWECGM